MQVPSPRIALLLLAAVATVCVGDPTPRRAIVVHGPDGQTASMVYNRGSTILDLKRSISKQLFIPIVNQRLFANGSELLHDTEQLFRCKLWRFPTIEVAERTKGFEINFRITSHQTNAQIQAHGSMTISQLRKKIYFLMGIYPTLVELQTQDGLIELVDTQRIAQLDIETDQAELCITNELNPLFNLRVETSQGWSFFIGVHLGFTVRSLKIVIENQLNFPYQDQKLFLAEVELSEDDKTLVDYQIWLHDSIKLDIGQIRPKRQLWLSKHRSTQRLPNFIEAYVDETIQSIRLKTSQLLQIPRGQLELGYSIKELENSILAEGNLLSDYINPGVEPETITLMDLRVGGMINVVVESVGMPVLRLRLHCSSNMFGLKKMIIRERNIDEDLYCIRLFLHDLELLDSETFLYYEAGYSVKIRYELEFKKDDQAITIISLIDDNRLYFNETNDIKTVGDLKALIESKWRISSKYQRLFYMGRELLDEEEPLDLSHKIKLPLATRFGDDFEYLEKLLEETSN